MFLVVQSYFYVVSTCLSILVLFTISINARFKTLATTPARVTEYEPEVIDQTCYLKPDYGPCRANVEMYFFDPAFMNCSKFRWGGCQGNGNRFDSFAECQTTCLSPRGERKRIPKYCSLSFDYGYCFGTVYRYYYDPLWKVCKKRIYSGCGGNLNNFYSIEQCESVCRFGYGLTTVADKDKGKNKRKALMISPWKHTNTTKEVEQSNTRIGPRDPQSIATSSTLDLNDDT